MLQARARVSSGDAAGGLKTLSDAADVVSERVQCLRALVTLAAQAGDDATVNEGVARITRAGCSGDAECSANLQWIGAFEEGRGNTRSALALYKRAFQRTPEDDRVLLTVARLAAATGLHAEAAQDYEQLSQRQPAQGRWKKAAGAEREEALRSVVGL